MARQCLHTPHCKSSCIALLRVRRITSTCPSHLFDCDHASCNPAAHNNARTIRGALILRTGELDSVSKPCFFLFVTSPLPPQDYYNIGTFTATTIRKNS